MSDQIRQILRSLNPSNNIPMSEEWNAKYLNVPFPEICDVPEPFQSEWRTGKISPAWCTQDRATGFKRMVFKVNETEGK